MLSNKEWKRLSETKKEEIRYWAMVRRIYKIKPIRKEENYE